MLDPVVIYVVSIVFAATLIRSALGFGEALVAVPLLAICIPLTVAAPLAVLISVIVALAILAQGWHHVETRSALGLIFSSLPGIPIGILLLARGNEHVVKSIVGVLVVGFSVYSLMANTTRRLLGEHYGWLIGCGFLSGVLGGAYGMNGPPLAIYGASRGWSPQHFRATLQGYFLPVSLAGLIGYAAVGLWSATLTRYFVLSLPAVGVALLLGRLMSGRISGRSFFRIVYGSLVAVGIVLIAQAITK